MKNITRSKELYWSNALSLPHWRQHAQTVDKILGYDYDKSEKGPIKKIQTLHPKKLHKFDGQKLFPQRQAWIGLSVQVLNTPYHLFALCLNFLKIRPHQLVVDLGAGHARLAFVMQAYAAKARYLGLELVPERVEEVKKRFQFWNIEHAEIQEQDLLHPQFQLKSADYYFLYDYGDKAHISQTLSQIEQQVHRKERPITLITTGSATHHLSKEHSLFTETRSCKKIESMTIHHFA